jgi:hypothetical protein
MSPTLSPSIIHYIFTLKVNLRCPLLSERDICSVLPAHPLRALLHLVAALPHPLHPPPHPHRPHRQRLQRRRRRLGAIHDRLLPIQAVQGTVHCKEISISVFPEKELRGLSPNFHIYVSVSDLYIPTFCPSVFLQQNRQTDQGNI